MSASSGRCFALLDDAMEHESASKPSGSRLYTGLARELVCSDASDLDAICREADQASRDGLHALLLCDYDFGARLQGLSLKSGVNDITAGCLRILLFKQMARLTQADVEVWLAAEDHRRTEPGIAGICAVHPGVSKAQYDAAIASIQNWLRAGDCYQINYTYPIHCSAFGTPVALYRRMRARQPAPYGALIALADGRVVLSCSPELFLQHRNGKLLAKPMKGTAAVASPTGKSEAKALLADPKNRAENLMIVDLLRNDLGRIATTGSVCVPALFSVERYADLLQMTSTVEAAPRPDLTLADVLRALFPCGSITGAPKRRAMELIDTIEAVPRGLYTGAIGWYDAASHNKNIEAHDDFEQRLGDFCFSVAIRTLELAAPQSDDADNGIRSARMGVGGGIVIDSEADLEYAECALKARFLTGLDPGFQLFETMYATHEGCRYLSLHLARLQASAAYFGFVWDDVTIKAKLSATCAALPSHQSYRLRLSLAHDGALTVTHAPLTVLDAPVKLLLSAQPMQTQDLFLRHKTTLRNTYDQAWQEAEKQGAFDVLFFNERDELTEGARSNVFVLRDGVWSTPPLACGLLPGVMRSVLLDDPDWNTKEQILQRADLMTAEAIMVCNALRGAVPANLAQR